MSLIKERTMGNLSDLDQYADNTKTDRTQEGASENKRGRTPDSDEGW